MDPRFARALGAKPKALLEGIVALAVFDDEREVRALTPDLPRVAKLHPVGVIVTAPGRGKVDFVSRFFAPAAGIDEDPVTGSAHCALAPYWAEKLGKQQLVAWQASRRGGLVRMKLSGPRVILAGQAVTVFRGELL